MILLIQRLDIFAIDTALIFKFHYDSINSVDTFFILHFFYNLNSIMILLIRVLWEMGKRYQSDLNSIMILLIPFFWYSMSRSCFNLNSIMILLIRLLCSRLIYRYNNLNSIMILLILSSFSFFSFSSLI